MDGRAVLKWRVSIFLVVGYRCFFKLFIIQVENSIKISAGTSRHQCQMKNEKRIGLLFLEFLESENIVLSKIALFCSIMRFVNFKLFESE